MTDAELVAEALAGSEDAHRQLVLRYQRPVYSLIIRMVRDGSAAEDLTQEVFIKAFRALDSYDPGRKFASWLFKIAHNATIDQLRKGQLQTVPLEDGSDEGTDFSAVLEDATAVGPDRKLHGRELGGVLEDAIRELRPAYREVILLRHREEMSYQEIAEITSSSLGTVKTNLHRARKELAEILRRDGWVQ